AEVLFGDQVGIRPDQVTGRTWGAKGTTPIVRRTGNRFSVNAMRAVHHEVRRSRVWCEGRAGYSRWSWAGVHGEDRPTCWPGAR
ncbi:transposase, partial [Streptomyces sp. Wh19]|uniref:transposase n=1 Tax=Streptomyces sp. Wh19 TaxID=3076629 RepID=UPI002E103F7E